MKRMFEKLIVLMAVLASAGCYLTDGSSSGASGYQPMGDYHETETVRSSLTRAAPDLDPSGPGYDEEDLYGYSSDCLVHAECGPNQVCAADPACPEYTYCYDMEQPEADGCDCGDRYYSVCYEGECVLRGTDCAQGCPTEAGYECGVGGFCVCVDDSCKGWEPPAAVARPAPPPEDACVDDMDCPEGCYCDDGQCVEGTRPAEDEYADSDPLTCDDNDDCPFESYCLFGECTDMYCSGDTDCPSGTLCAEGECVEPGTRQVAESCSTHGQCKTAFCSNGKCRQMCDVNADCGDYECQEPPHVDWGEQTYCWGPRCGNCRDNQYCTVDGDCRYP